MGNHTSQGSTIQQNSLHHGKLILDKETISVCNVFQPIFNAESVTLLTRSQDQYKGNKYFYHYKYTYNLICGYYRIHGINPNDIATVSLMYFGTSKHECIFRFFSNHVSRMILFKFDVNINININTNTNISSLNINSNYNRNIIIRYVMNHCYAKPLCKPKYICKIGIIGVKYKHCKSFLYEFQRLKCNLKGEFKDVSFDNINKHPVLTKFDICSFYLTFLHLDESYKCFFCVCKGNYNDKIKGKNKNKSKFRNHVATPSENDENDDNVVQLYHDKKFNHQFCLDFENDIKIKIFSRPTTKCDIDTKKYNNSNNNDNDKTSDIENELCLSFLKNDNINSSVQKKTGDYELDCLKREKMIEKSSTGKNMDVINDNWKIIGDGIKSGSWMNGVVKLPNGYQYFGAICNKGCNCLDTFRELNFYPKTFDFAITKGDQFGGFGFRVTSQND